MTKKASSETIYSAMESAGETLVVDGVPVAATTRVEVLAPATLAAGYELHVDLNGTPAVVRVVRVGVVPHYVLFDKFSCRFHASISDHHFRICSLTSVGSEFSSLLCNALPARRRRREGPKVCR